MGRWGDEEKKKAEGAEGAEEEKLLIASRASPALFYAQCPMPNSQLPIPYFSNIIKCCCGRISLVSRQVNPTAFISFLTCF